MLTDSEITKFQEHKDKIKANPMDVFGQQGADDSFFNTRYGDLPGKEIDMHNDEPYVMGQATLSSGSDSSDSEDEYEKEAHRGAL